MCERLEYTSSQWQRNDAGRFSTVTVGMEVVVSMSARDNGTERKANRNLALTKNITTRQTQLFGIIVFSRQKVSSS